ncbi:malate dehydrogenase [Candidatus Vidania fulgoroideae]|nr:malate dehydrogenase [Candidatus Vidania fulgoroideae]
MKESVLKYHSYPVPGKLFTGLSKPIFSKADLALAYTPGVACVSKLIAKNEKYIYSYTGKGNLVAVITNGSAVLGLGNIGAAAAKPVMEGKSALFRRFAFVDSYDIEISESDPQKLIAIIIALGKTFGGINLEDIKSPECFYIEEQCSRSLDIPVFHDDQHGTAVVVTAALINAVYLVNKSLSKLKVVVVGAGAAAIACLNLLVRFGLNKCNVFVYDIKGPLVATRTDLDCYRSPYMQSSCVPLSTALYMCDFFLGLSSGNILQADWVALMAPNPIIFALANPIPEIFPKVIKSVRTDAIVATGRSDFPNQVNNLLCFPYIFRAALDARVLNITTAIKIAAVKAIAYLGFTSSHFTFENILPGIFDKRLLVYIAGYIMKVIIFKKLNRVPINFKRYLTYLCLLNV